MTSPVSVLLVEDHELLAQTLQVALASAGVATEVVALTSAQAVLTVVERLRPTLVLLDLELGEPIGDGAALVPPIVALGSSVLVVTGVTDLTRVAAAVEAGAVGYIAKSLPFTRLLAVVQEALAGRPVLAEAQRRELFTLLRRRRADSEQLRAPFDRLTPREEQVLRALAEGHSVESIAEQWVVSKATVRTQVRGILTKLDVGTQLAAVARARQAGWLETARRTTKQGDERPS